MAFLSRSKTPVVPAALGDAMARHVAIIMDGNGRWAQSRGLPRTAGHKKGADTLHSILQACRDFGVECLTIYAFSSENWRRPQAEIRDLMQLLRQYLAREMPTMHKNGVRMRFIGDMSLLDEDIRKDISEAERMTEKNHAFTLTVALSYGGREELARAVRKLAERVKSGAIEPQDIDEEQIAQSLDTAGLPEPDLLIRTGGEQRISNFLLWQSAYTEFYFTPVLWPDFSAADFKQALDEFSRRERRYGTAPAS